MSTRHFPYRAASSVCRAHRALIGVGGNVGDVPGRFERLWRYWRQSRQVAIVRSSPILINPPFGYTEQPDFYNTVIEVCTALDPQELLRYILYTEKRFGRTRSFANAPRTLDLDMIFYDERVIATSRLQVPHPQWHERDSVVMPLGQLQGERPW